MNITFNGNHIERKCKKQFSSGLFYVSLYTFKKVISHWELTIIWGFATQRNGIRRYVFLVNGAFRCIQVNIQCINSSKILDTI